MTESTTLPAARPRKILTQIAPVTWEHPADRAALQSLRSVPGFDEVVKKIYGFIGERGVRLFFQADAVRVGPTQFPRLNQLYTDVLTSMDWSERPELFVSQTPFANAGAFGMDKPFIVINSGTLRLLDDDEVRNVLGHELGHVMSGHALYHTILVLILNVSLGALPFLAGIAILPIQLALLEWFRKSELSSDRAGLLACQDPTASLRVNLKFAGGGDMSQMDLNAFLAQAREYEAAGGALDRIFKILGVLGRTHPFNTVRAAELQRWIEEGHYDRVLQGEYTTRGPGYRRSAGALYEGSEGRRGRRRGHRQAGGPGLLGRLQEEVRVLVVGGGGREHALCWALKRDTPDADLFAAPGNPGTAQLGANLDIPATAVDDLVGAVRQHDIDYTIVGPEAPLAAGLADRLRAAGHAVFGPSQAAARIESSKAFAKDVMQRARIPTAASRTFTALDPALVYIKRHAEPLVVKASGLAGGKGAVVCATRDDAARTVRAMLAEGAFGDAGREVVVEDFLEGEELSVLALTDGDQLVLLPAAQDHKRLGDGDAGPNTGGMGAYCPVSIATDGLREQLRRRVLEPALRELAARGAPYQGVLYAGIMLAADGTPSVLEFNCRFGDPETQALLPVLPGVTTHLRDIAMGNWRPRDTILSPSRAAVATVLAASGYPDKPRLGAAVDVPRDLEPGTLVFHAGTSRDPDGTVRVAGGRVLTVTGLGDTVAAARERSAQGCELIGFEGKTYRRDIAWREIRRTAEGAGAARG